MLPAALEQLGGLHNDWPADPLWMPAVRTGDGQRVVFGRDEYPPLGTAIAASCAIPLLLRPVRIGKHHYIDGATHSPTNADLLVGAGVEVAIVIAPMSGRPEALRRRPDHALRAAFARRLREDEQQLVHAGLDVHRFEPDAAGLNTLGINPIDRSRTIASSPTRSYAKVLAVGGRADGLAAPATNSSGHNHRMKKKEPFPPRSSDENEFGWLDGGSARPVGAERWRSQVWQAGLRPVPATVSEW